MGARRAGDIEPEGRRRSRLGQVLTAAAGGVVLMYGMRRRGPLAWVMRLAGARLAGRAAARRGRY